MWSDWLNGANQYHRLRVPANMPVREFGSVTVYDFETRSMIQTDTNVANCADRQREQLDQDAAGVWLVGVVPLLGPTEPFFDKSWRLPDFEKA